MMSSETIAFLSVEGRDEPVFSKYLMSFAEVKWQRTLGILIQFFIALFFIVVNANHGLIKFCFK